MEGWSLLKSRGLHLIILGTLLGSASALYDKYLLGVLHIPQNILQFWFAVNLVLILRVVQGIKRGFFARKATEPFQWRWSIPATGCLLILSDFLYFHALSQPDTYISMVSLVRRCNCLVSFFVGVLWFKEVNVKRKALALLLILAGVFLLMLC